MKNLSRILVSSISLLVLSSIGFSAHSAATTQADTFQKVNVLIDFSDYESGSVEQWLREKGFEFKRDARNRKKLDLDVSDDALILEAKRRMRGFLINDSVDLEEFSTIRIEWGILKYPEGATYEDRVNNEALMVMVFFGHDRMPSGHFAIPSSPYFIGFFLGKEEQVNKGYKGKYFRKAGRFVCLGNPEPGETVISEYDLVSAFKRKYVKDEVPLISGIALAVDTSSSDDGGKAAAFIKRIEFLE